MELDEPVVMQMLPVVTVVCWVESPVVTVGILNFEEFQRLEGIVGFE